MRRLKKVTKGTVLLVLHSTPIFYSFSKVPTLLLFYLERDCWLLLQLWYIHSCTFKNAKVINYWDSSRRSTWAISFSTSIRCSIAFDYSYFFCDKLDCFPLLVSDKASKLTPFSICHACYFHGLSWVQFKSAFGPAHDLWWPADEQVNLPSFPVRSSANSPTTEGWKPWLACTANPNQEPGIECTRWPAPPPTALARAPLRVPHLRRLKAFLASLCT